jgi:hypothetical protein
VARLRSGQRTAASAVQAVLFTSAPELRNQAIADRSLLDPELQLLEPVGLSSWLLAAARVVLVVLSRSLRAAAL